MSVRQAIDAALAHQAAGRLAEAEDVCRQILQHQPNHPGVLHLRGMVLDQQGRTDQAIECYQRSRQLQGDDPALLTRLSGALREVGRLTEAESCARAAVGLRPEMDEAHACLAVALHLLRRHEESEAAYRQAIALRGDQADYHSGLGNLLADTGRLTEAVACYRQALALRPTAGEIHSNLGAALLEQGQVDQAIAATRQAVALCPTSPAIHSNLLFQLLFSPATTVAGMAQELAQWEARHARPLYAAHRPHGNDRNPDRPLRIGYVSPDLRGHIVGRLLETFLVHHDHSQFHITCYSDAMQQDAVTESLREHSDQWRDCRGINDPQLAELVRSDGIDILVDLDLHMANNRMLAFARKPAPVQVTYLGCPASSGLSAMDYRLTDQYLSPPGHALEGPEKLEYLPQGYWPYKPAADAPQVNELPAISKGHVTFGSFNNFAKVNDRVLALWAKLMRELPGSEIHLLIAGGERNTHVHEAFQRLGIDKSRVKLLDRRPTRQYLELHRDVDIVLDPFPYNGHTTSHDALYMGVPVVSLLGQRAVSRAGLSILSNLGLSKLVAETEDQYLAIALSLANDLPRLAELRRTLRPRLCQSPLMDAPAFAREIEAAYRRMWRRWVGP